SDGPDAATATYHPYQISSNFFPDYPKWAIWPDAIYLGLNAGFVEPMVALNKAKMLAGMPLTDNDANLEGAPGLPNFEFQLLTPVDIDGATPPPAGSPGIFVRHLDDESQRPKGSRDHAKDFIEYFEMTTNFIT